MAGPPRAPGGASRVGAGWWVVGAALAIVVVGVIIVVMGTRTSDPGSGPHVVVVGDSVTFMAAADLQDAFDWTSNVNVQGRSGYRTDELLPVARDVLATDPDIAVFLPGYNDVWQEADTDEAVAEMVALAARAPCAVWMLLPTKGDYDPERMEDFNARVEELADEHDSIHVDASWRDRVDATDGPEPDLELVSDDLVHPTDAGTRALAEEIEAAVSRHCR